MIELKSFAMESHQGPYLNLNEDSVDADIVNNLFVLLDGFGGSNIGDLAASKVKTILKNAYQKIADDPDSTLPFYYSSKYLLEGNAIINAFYKAHQSIYKENEEKLLDYRGGVSAMAAGLAENILTIVSTGNLAAFLYRNGSLTQEVIPDSLKNLSGNQSEIKSQNIPMSGIGLFEELHYSVREIKLLPDDIILLMTDGVYSKLTHEEIKQILDSGFKYESEIINRLITLSNEKGNLDNQSAIVLSF